MIENQAAFEALTAPVRTIGAHLSVHDGSTLTHTFTGADALKSFTVDRAGAGRFFGFGFCQRLNFKLVDVARALEISAGNQVDVAYYAGGSSVSPYPSFYVSEVHRDENTNGLSITAYDAVKGAEEQTVGELAISAPYTLLQFAASCAQALGLSLDVDRAEVEAWDIEYPEGANFGGGETLREALDDIAEATQTVYYANAAGALAFVRISPDAEAVLNIGRADYMKASAKTNRRLAAIMSTTELGDNVVADTGQEGTTAYLRDNAFLSLREDLGELLEGFIEQVGGLTVGQYSMDWRGNYLLELGDCFTFTTKDGEELQSFFLDDKATYNGGYRQSSGWEYEDEDETEGNASNLGDRLRQTFARVDKANRQIDLLASEQTAQGEQLAALQINTGSISATVSSLQSATNAALQGQASDIAQLRQTVAASMTSEAVDLRITQALEGGVSSVTTETGFTFNADGLSISRSGSEMQTTVNEDGLRISRSGEEVLRADNEGVKAEDLHATTYLIIGENSRFEDFTDGGTPKTGCFWIGATSA